MVPGVGVGRAGPLGGLIFKICPPRRPASSRCGRARPPALLIGLRSCSPAPAPAPGPEAWRRLHQWPLVAAGEVIPRSGDLPLRGALEIPARGAEWFAVGPRNVEGIAVDDFVAARFLRAQQDSTSFTKLPASY